MNSEVKQVGPNTSMCECIHAGWSALQNEVGKKVGQLGEAAVTVLTSLSSATATVCGSADVGGFLARVITNTASIVKHIFGDTESPIVSKLESCTDVISATRIFLFPHYLLNGGFVQDWKSSRFGQIVSKAFWTIGDAISTAVFIQPSLRTKEICQLNGTPLTVGDAGPIAACIAAFASLVESIQKVAKQKFCELSDCFSFLIDGSVMVAAFLLAARIEARVAISAFFALSSAGIVLSSVLPLNK